MLTPRWSEEGLGIGASAADDLLHLSSFYWRTECGYNVLGHSRDRRIKQGTPREGVGRVEEVGRVMCLDLTHRRVMLLCYDKNNRALDGGSWSCLRKFGIALIQLP